MPDNTSRSSSLWSALAKQPRELDVWRSQLGQRYVLRPDKALEEMHGLESAVREFLDLEQWDPTRAIWLLSTGELLRSQEGTVHVQFRRAMVESSFSPTSEIPLRDALRWIRSLHKFKHGLSKSRRPHDWIRWGIRKGLPIHDGFWRSYYRWKAMQWGKGVQLAALVFAYEDGDEQVDYFPAEDTWLVALSLEKQLRLALNLRAVRFDYFWHVPTEGVIRAAGAVSDRRGQRDGDDAAARRERIRRTGKACFLRIEAAVKRLARKRGVEAVDSSGRYFFGLTRADLIKELKLVDGKLRKVGAESFTRALGGLVRGRPPGRPSKL